MRDFDLSPQQFADLAHLLPESFIALITVVGAEAAFTLLKHYAGTTIPVGRNRTRAGRLLHAALTEVLDEECATRLEEAYAGQRKLWIPKCDDALRELRDRFIRHQFDVLTTQNRMTATCAVNNLAAAHRLSDRHIWALLKRPDSTPPPRPVQTALF